MVVIAVLFSFELLSIFMILYDDPIFMIIALIVLTSKRLLPDIYICAAFLV